MATQLTSAKVSITPTMATNPFLAGYAAQVDARVATSNTPYAPIYARCLVLWQDGNPHLIVTLDVLAIPTVMNKRLRAKLLPLASWSDSDIVLHSVHTHNGPALEDSLQPYMSYNLSDLGLVRAYTAWLEDQVVATVTSALNKTRETVTLDYATTTQHFAINRAGLSTVETTVPVLAARRADGTPAAVLFSYGCHPIAAGVRTLYDGDYAAGACAYVEKARSNCFAIFVNGAGGDQNPTDPTGTNTGWALRDELANSLGSAIDSTLRTRGRALAGLGQTSLTAVDVPFDMSTSASNLATVRGLYETRINNPIGWPSYYSRHAEVMVSRIDSNAVPDTLSVPMQAWRFPGASGQPELRVAFMGGEAVSGYAVTLRSRYGGTNGIICASYANEVTCYVPTDAFLPPLRTGGSYEGGWDTDVPSIAGGAMAVYGHHAHFRPGSHGVEQTVLAGLDSILT
jgi:neutral ceramidase